ncbi:MULTISPECIES: LytR/AlgR family response regulator transcription factor [Hungatella]|uniref:LytR/AlgR family response regulator transcription factor n=1 Tax=Hungatella TaxID=1649459 RepID=UPI0011DD0520|nr:LytTR family DNA-binding domain-containing protein [Hungatella hathewayi]
MLQIAICDDENYYRETIRTLLTEYLERRGLEYALSLFLSGEEFVSQAENAVKYDVVFMDISMSHVNGIETAAWMRSLRSETAIVFVTAFLHYAPEGYKVDAVRFIMKDTLEAALPECMDAVLKRKRLELVEFSCVEGTVRLFTERILYVESRKHKAVFCCQGTEPETCQAYLKLDEVERRLKEYGFLRIHKSYLVNMRHVRRIRNYEAELDNGERLPIPRPRFQAVKEEYAVYKGAMPWGL